MGVLCVPGIGCYGAPPVWRPVLMLSQAGLKLQAKLRRILWLLSPGCWDYSSVLLCLIIRHSGLNPGVCAKLLTEPRTHSLLVYLFEKRFLCSLGYSGTCSIGQAGLELRYPPTSAFQVLNLKRGAPYYPTFC